MFDHTYGHTPVHKAFELLDVYGIGHDPERATRAPIRLGVIGAGGVAQSKYYPAVARLRMIWEPIEIAAFVEPQRDHADKVQRVYGGRAYTDYRQMLNDEELNGVIVLSPDHLHREHTLAALEAGLPVLVEKPIARSLVDAAQMVKRAEDKGLLLMAVANKRFSPPYRRAKHLIEQGIVPDPALFAGKFNLGYDYVDLLESGTIHLYDVMRYLMGDVRSVTAMGVNKHGHNRRHYPVDNVVTNVAFASGAIGTLYTSSSALNLKPWERVEVYGDHAWLAVEDQHELILYSGEETPTKSWRTVVPNTLLFDEEFGGYMGIVENFVQSIRGAETPLVTGNDGYLALEVLRAVQLGIIQQQMIRLPLDAMSAEREVAAWLKRSGWVG